MISEEDIYGLVTLTSELGKLRVFMTSINIEIVWWRRRYPAEIGRETGNLRYIRRGSGPLCLPSPLINSCLSSQTSEPSAESFNAYLMITILKYTEKRLYTLPSVVAVDDALPRF
jgi:hypothetical protein